MLSLAAVIGFGIAIIPLVLTPGASFALVSARGLMGDRRGAWETIGGTAAGIVSHAVLAGVGLAAVVMRSAELYRILRLAGAAYLLCLGCWLLWRACRGPVASGRPRHHEQRQPRRPGFVQAYVANLVNIKAASVYLTLAPQFVDPNGVVVLSMLTLAGVHVVVMAAWLGMWSLGLSSMTARIDPRRGMRAIDGAGGVALMVMAVRQAQARP